MGHCVKLSPAKTTNPILSFGLPSIKSCATCLAASSLLGLKSSANIELEISIASVISIPSELIFSLLRTVCGLAKIAITRAIVQSLKKRGRWIKYSLKLFLREYAASKFDILISGYCFL